MLATALLALFAVSVIVGFLGVASAAINVIVVLCLVILVPTLWLGSLIEALKAPDTLWSAAGQNKVTFVLLIVLLILLGAVLYLTIARPALRRAALGAGDTT